MATAKKKSSAKTSTKSSAKKAVKYAAKANNTATHAAVKAAKGAASDGSYWAKKGAEQWQKGAQDWMSQSSKLLQFQQGADLSGAAEQMKAAGEQAMKMGSDFMSQFFGGSSPSFSSLQNMMPSLASLPNFGAAFNPAKAQGAFGSIGREAAEQLQKSAGSANRALGEAMELSRENAEAVVEVSNAAISTSKELGAEVISYLNKIFAQNVELSKQALTCRTLNDLFDLASRVMKTNLDGFFTESVKLSELLFQSATDIAEPLNERVSETTERLSKAMAA